METQPRPRAIAVVAGFLFAASGIAAVAGSSLLFPGALLQWLSHLNGPGMAVFERIGSTAGVLLLALALGTAAAGMGLLRQKRWAWRFAVGLFLVNGCGDVASFFLTGDAGRSFSGVVICSAFLYALTKPNSRLYFRRASGS